MNSSQRCAFALCPGPALTCNKWRRINQKGTYDKDDSWRGREINIGKLESWRSTYKYVALREWIDDSVYHIAG